MTAAELIAKLALLPPDTVIAVDGDDQEPHHVSRTALSVVHPGGIAFIDASPRLVEGAPRL